MRFTDFIKTTFWKSPLSFPLRQTVCSCINQQDNRKLICELLILKRRINLLIINPIDVYIVNRIINLDSILPAVGKNEKLLNIQRSIFAINLNYVKDLIRNSNCNHSREESCASSCNPLDLIERRLKFSFISTSIYGTLFQQPYLCDYTRRQTCL